MPIYEYECENRHRFELRQSFTDDPVTSCPNCDLTARRLIPLVPVHFKGSGFYVTDYGRGNGAASSPNGAGSKESEGSEAGASSAVPKASEGAKSVAQDT